FQGRAMTGPYTREDVYWLVRTGGGRALATRSAGPGVAAAARAFSDTLRYEVDNRWLASLVTGDGDDRWMWGDALDAHAPNLRQMTVTLAVRNPAPDPAAAQMTVRLQGYTDDPDHAPDHHVVAT